MLKGCPRIADVFCMEEILQKLGAVTWWEDHDLYMDCENAGKWSVPFEFTGRMRSSVILLGALLARNGKGSLGYPGGCVIGKRPIDMHLFVLRKLGAVITEKQGFLVAEAPYLQGALVSFSKRSVGATQQGILGAVLADGETVLENCACEPEIQWLCRYMRSMGAKIQGDGTVTLKIPKSDYFEVMNEDGSEAVSGIQIAKGDSLMFMVQPKTGLTKGDYSDTLIFESEEDSEVAVQVTAEVSVKEAEQEQITAVKADPESFSYDDLKEGYDTPEATTITLTNTGNTTVSLMQPYAEYFDIGELSASVLEPGDSAAFTAVPVTGLKVGNYLDSIQIAQTSSEGQEDVLTTIKASATVSEVKKIYKLSVTPEELNFGKAKEGYSEAPEAQKVTVTNKGNTNVTLNAPSGKNFKIGKLSATELAPGESCTFKIRPKEGLKAGSYTESVVIDNEQQISAEVKVQFTVKAARKAKNCRSGR